jgi:dethiobiotin synthetase
VTRTRGCFVTGTDTGVGKTRVACALLRGLRARGVDAGAMKPIETGVGRAGPLDALALRAAAGDGDPLDDVCPERFALAAAPSAAARHEGREVDLAHLDAAFARLAARHQLMVVEGAGGLRVPVAPGCVMADLARRWRLPLLVVARAALGTINHTRLTLESAARSGTSVLGLVISHADGPLSPADRANLAELLDDPGGPLLGVLPPLAPGEEPAEDALDWAGLIAALTGAR